MIIDSKYSKSFVSNSLTRKKYDELYNLAITIREHKNEISKIVSSNLEYYLDIKKYEFTKHFYSEYSDKISSNFYNKCYIDIYTCYQNKFESISNKLVFEKLTLKNINLYQKKTKNNTKGDFKSITFTKSKTELTNCLTYLIRYGNSNTINYIKNQLEIETRQDKISYYNSIIRIINKFGFERLMKLANDKKTRIIKRYNTPIEFKSLTFGGRSRKKVLIDYNKNYNSKINTFISLSWIGRKSLDIPIKFAKDYHNNIKDYKKNTNDYEYTVTFNEKKKQVNVILCKDGERFIPEPNGDIVGIDVNVKHNLFSLSNGETYDYDRELLNDYCKLMSTVKKTNEIGKRKQHKINTLKNKMIKSNQNLIATICKELSQKGYGHIVMENLDNGFGKSFYNVTEQSDINFNRITKFIGLTTMKNEVERISRKYNIAVSLVHSEYTSKQCNVCGNIDDANRPTQETFICTDCNYSSNADYNASINIKKRVTETVFQVALLQKTDNNSFKPKLLSRDKVKKALLSQLNNNNVNYCRDISDFN